MDDTNRAVDPRKKFAVKLDDGIHSPFHFRLRDLH